MAYSFDISEMEQELLTTNLMAAFDGDEDGEDEEFVDDEDEDDLD